MDIDNSQVIAKLTIDSTLYEKLEVQLYSHFQLNLGPIIKDNKPINFLEHIIPPSSWLCNHCDTACPDAQVQCVNCHAFRNVGAFPNIIYDPAGITEQEAGMFSKRRALEKKLICGRDLITSDLIKTDGCWYLMSSEWLKEWKAFIFNKPRSNSIVIPYPEIGVLPPGPISNHTLLLEDGVTPKANLKKVAFLINFNRV